MRLIKVICLAFVISLVFGSCTVQTAYVSPRPKVVAVKTSYPKAVVYKNVTYYHSKGVWYKKNRNKYVVVRPPIGIRITTLPKGYKVVKIGKKSYYKYHGVYYQKRGVHYTVVRV